MLMPRVKRQIRWTHPTQGWVKLNTDGVSRGNPGEASVGGVIRDNRGLWCRGFVLNIGTCTVRMAELWSVYYGLVIAWESRAQRVEMEIDLEMIVGFLKTWVSEVHPLSFLVRLCHGFITKDWIVRIFHVYREANRLADGLANYTFTLPLGFHAFDSVPCGLNSLLFEDSSGISITRRIRM
ncbi:unnamed protein product [Microthlaspi erraticum]|uniref:RNase H type-1 domain-containing protein n=1 Tax=Microthlaspi erraticum TaxID=1685480 RepID=A0A6D2HZF1_9BRAS|nr:unnamed protein product [Microthlaspi erraticum]